MKTKTRNNGTLCDKVGHGAAASSKPGRNGTTTNRIADQPLPDELEFTADDLTPDKANAIVALLSGHTISEAAGSVGVNRKTIYRWMKHDAAFRAVLNHGRRELLDSMHARLMVLAHDAADCVERAVLKDDGRTALQLLRGLGFLNGRVAAPTDS